MFNDLINRRNIIYYGILIPNHSYRYVNLVELDWWLSLSIFTRKMYLIFNGLCRAVALWSGQIDRIMSNLYRRVSTAAWTLVKPDKCTFYAVYYNTKYGLTLQ